MNGTIYLDNNATTRTAPECLDAVLACLRDEYGNPSSKHAAGERARRLVNEARAQVGELLGAQPAEIVFTSGGTESNHMAILGALARDPQRQHVVTSAVEHPSTLQLLRHLEARAVRVTVLPVDAQGRLDPAAIEAAIAPDTALVSLLWANNETGVLFPVEHAARIARERDVLLHLDAVQAVGKLAVDLRQLPADLLSLSGHKLHAPKGVGALFVRKGVKLPPLLFGHQERARRGGTENVPAIAGLGIAATLAAEMLEIDMDQMTALRNRLEQGVRERVPFASVNGGDAARVANTSNIRFGDLVGEAIAARLDRVGVSVALGAACTAGSSAPSHVLTAMGLEARAALASVRFSLSRYTSGAEIERVLDLLPGIVRSQAAAA
jgi:cysteine desulfurase